MKVGADESMTDVGQDYFLAKTGCRSILRQTGYKPILHQTGYKPILHQTGYKPVLHATGCKPVLHATGVRLLLMVCVLVAICACEKVDRTDSLSKSQAASVGKPKIVTTQSGIEMVLIPAGRFVMGSDQGEPDQQPAHEVELDAFLMDRYEVTQSVYDRLDPINGSHFKGPDLPTEMISWGKAALYCNLRSEAEGLEPCYDDLGQCDFDARGYRLPTEAEWEYACRAGNKTAYSFGSDTGQLSRYAWFKANASKKTHAVGKKPANAWGLYDMHGNVAEWCNDFYAEDYYQDSPNKNPRGPTESEKNVLRGGHWGASSAICRSAHRMNEEPGFSDACFARDAIGFRCVKNAPADLLDGVEVSIGQEVSADSYLVAAVAKPWTGSADGGLAPAATTGVESIQTAASVGFVYSDVCLQHDTGVRHPERKERLTAIVTRLQESQLLDELIRIQTRAAPERWLTTVHTARHIESVRKICAQGGRFAGSRDTPVSRQSYQAALHAAGAALAAVDAVMAGKITSAFCAIRPPGHHAMRDRAMGFCLFNNVAIAARYVQQEHQLKRVLIVDWDVHHGNGTEALFLEDPWVFYFSVHQFPFYPGTGSADQRGVGEGLGATLNVPLPAGSGDAEFLQAIEKDLVKAAAQFRPEFVLISAGFDAHKDDPLGGMNVTKGGYAQMTRVVKGIADTYCQGRMVSLLEGGYDLEGLAASVEMHLRVLNEKAR